MQLWSFGWLPGQGDGASQVGAGSLVGLQNEEPRRSRLSKPWSDSGEADRLLRKEGVGGFGSLWCSMFLQHEEDIALGLTGMYLASRLKLPVESGFGVGFGFFGGIQPMVECG